MKILKIQTNTETGQAIGSYLCIQIRWTRILFLKFWLPPTSRGGCLLVRLLYPKPSSGLRCNGFSVKYINYNKLS